MTADVSPLLTSTDVSLELGIRYGIRASRDRVARMADALWGRDSSTEHRRFAESDIEVMAAAMTLLEVGLTRSQAAELLQDPGAAAEWLAAERDKRLRQYDVATKAMEAMAG